MKVVGLISGGKDSCYAMMRCLDYGHQIVALGNLLPLDDSVDELDSFMYQTVGHQIVIAYAQCMGLPLFRRRIRGTSSAKDLRYSVTEDDEVEDLYMLLREVQRHFPTIEGVSCGAIASDYQRMRVENVCHRLGLVSLAFLWKQDQTSLLQRMIANGIQAIFVKVAAIGLNPHSHLGKNLAEMQPGLTRLHNLYGINVCGEGGEYETLTLDCPLFKNFKIVLDKYEIILHSPDSIAPVGVLHPLEFWLEHKALDSSPEEVPPLMSWVQEVEGNPGEFVVQQQESVIVKKVQHCSHEEFGVDVNIVSNTRHESFAVISCWIRSKTDLNGTDYELDFVLTSIARELGKDNLGWQDVLYIHLYINDMAGFNQANQIYMQHITEKLCVAGVPSRSTVELALKKNNLGRVMVEVITSRYMNKKVLHVQSISCWAPSCIGPYSQATLHKEVLYMAGQLGLDPPTMLLISGGANSEMKQALLNCEAVAQAFSASVVQSSISILVYVSSAVAYTERKEVETTLEEFLALQRPEGSEDSRVQCSSKIPVLYVQVPALPKGAKVEVEPLLYVPLCNEGYNNGGLMLQRIFDQVCKFSVSHSSVVAGHACRAFVSISSRTEVENSGIDNVDPDTTHTLTLNIPPQDVLGGLRSSLRVLSKILAEAFMCWEDVLALRVFFVSDVLPLGSIIGNWNQALEEILMMLGQSSQQESQIFCNTVGLSSLRPLFLPVLHAGQNSKMHDIITLDLLALR